MPLAEFFIYLKMILEKYLELEDNQLKCDDYFHFVLDVCGG